MVNYELVNPVVSGSFPSTYQTSNPMEAAKKFWETLTVDNGYISGNVPQFLFTLMDTSDKKLYHFKVQEKPNGNGAKYSIDEVNVDMSAEQKRNFFSEISKMKRDVVKNMKQHGGKRRRDKDPLDDDSSSSSSSSDDVDSLFRNIRLKQNRPIVYWWYYPTVYKIDKIFTPTFITPIVPYVQLWVPLP